MNWYPKKGGSGQGLVIDEKTGANIAVAYDNAHVELLAAAPALLAAAETLLEAMAWEEKRSGTTYNGVESLRAAIRAAKGGAS